MYNFSTSDVSFGNCKNNVAIHNLTRLMWGFKSIGYKLSYKLIHIYLHIIKMAENTKII